MYYSVLQVQGKLADGSSISPGAEKETAAVATNLLVEDIEVPENVLMDMLDIKILEALQQGQNIEEAANFLIHEATTSKIYPNTNVLIALVQSICNKRDLALLAKIKQHLPHQSEPIEQLAQFEVSFPSCTYIVNSVFP